MTLALGAAETFPNLSEAAGWAGGKAPGPCTHRPPQQRGEGPSCFSKIGAFAKIKSAKIPFGGAPWGAQVWEGAL